MPEPADLDALADELRRLAPRDAGLDRDATMFRAGRASAPRGWVWPAVAAASSLTAVVLGVALLVQPPPQSVTITTHQIEEAPSFQVSHVEEPPTDSAAHRRLRDQVLRDGLDSLAPAPPQPPQPPHEPRSYHTRINELFQGESSK